MESTQVDVVIDALVSTFEDASLDGLEVIDGQPLAMDSPDCLVVGWSPSRPAAEIRQESSALYDDDQRSETLDIACVLSVWRGDTDAGAAQRTRTAAKARLDEIRDVLRADRSLGGIVDRAALGFDGTLDQAQTADGPTVTFDFIIQVRSL